MRCRQCGTEIADKALICYRCGAATTEATFKPLVASGRGVSMRTVALGAGAILLLLAIGWLILSLIPQ